MLPRELVERYERLGVWSGETVPARAQAVARERSDAIAFIDTDRAMSFADAWSRIERMAGGLAARVSTQGDPVLWRSTNRWEAAIVHHAILRAGLLPVPVGPGAEAAELAAIVRAIRPHLIITLPEHRGIDLMAQAHKVAPDPDVISLEDALALDGEPPPVPTDPAARALVLHTSGTTGAPKGVVHTHRGLLCEVDSFRDIHALTDDDRALIGPPVTHIAGLAYGILAPFALGTSSVLLDRWDGETAAALLDQHEVTFMTGPPTFLLTMAEHVTTPPPLFRLFSTGGATIPADRIAAAGARMGCTIKRAYGSTEVPTLTAGRLDDDEGIRLATDGRPIGAAELDIRDGEILARAPEMFTGYWHDEKPFDADGWFATGDLGEVDVAGNLRVTGRRKDLIIRGGENISAQEVEVAIRALGLVRDVAVIGVPDDTLGERTCAVIVPDGPPPSLEDVVASLRATGLATHKLPEVLHVVDTLPVNDNGKVRKDDLRARFG